MRWINDARRPPRFTPGMRTISPSPRPSLSPSTLAAIPAAYALETVPRYTSYPTAAQFGPGIDEALYRHWLAELDGTTPLSLYVHVPYCRVLCWYCGCHTSVLNDDARIARYASRLEEEAARVAAAMPRKGPVAHLHFGGGTPTILAPADFARVIARLKAEFPFAPDAEIAVEIDPRTLTQEMTAALAGAGVNRVSLGVQDVDPEIQRLVHRVQPTEQVAAAVAMLRAHGIDRINVDLMYGLPTQTVAHVRATVAAMLAMNPDRAAVFGYAHVPWFAKHQAAIDAALLPGAAERLAQAQAAADAFAEAGWVEVGFDHYARPEDPLAIAVREGTLKRNFQGYTTDRAETLIGLGASSIGALPQGYAQNEPHLGKWAQAVDEGRIPVVRGVPVTAEDALRRAAIYALMSAFDVDLGALAAERGFASDHLDADLARLAPLAADGLCTIEGRRVRVPPHARFHVRNVAARLDGYWAPQATRHSRAV
ncbi:oxygen-independent coproporphyrinogen III oxidase [Salinarimonas ramus]|uniref:Coproporphyrinogen-III oxidase n=1 Tax=Salinarimonas ramus TaxID=690164 RepID=A0A917V8A7_9HYPH|nr:oxygen-independent coproporphyrinogen III oxidase [Salinarimonas ramus]GGK49720.1 oxygen-independent coproporphyrinogen III oxidase [Salinarimonas ramus]